MTDQSRWAHTSKEALIEQLQAAESKLAAQAGMILEAKEVLGEFRRMGALFDRYKAFNPKADIKPLGKAMQRAAALLSRLNGEGQ